MLFILFKFNEKDLLLGKQLAYSIYFCSITEIVALLAKYYSFSLDEGNSILLSKWLVLLFWVDLSVLAYLYLTSYLFSTLNKLGSYVW